MAKLLYFISEDWFFCSHFIDRAHAAQRAGHEVVVLTRVGTLGEKLRAGGLRCIPLQMSRSGMNPLRELKVLFQVLRAYRDERPDLVHHVALKPILYGSLIARCLRIGAVVNAPVGMGHVFTASGFRARVVRWGVQLALRALMNPRGSKVVFENREDLDSQVRANAVRRSDAVLIPGAGIDLKVFYPACQRSSMPHVVVLGARMLRDKGIAEFVEASRILKAQGSDARFWLVGDVDCQNPSSFKREQLVAWQKEGAVEWLGKREDMACLLRQASIACLPSYREGLPKFLLEAMASALPVVSTDVPGCRQAVLHGQTGLLVSARDAGALAQALAKLLADAPLRGRLGASGLKRVQDEFSLERIVAMTLALYASLLTRA